MNTSFVARCEIRSRFSAALSDMYRRELAAARQPSPEPYEHRLAQALAAFPDDLAQLAEAELIYVRHLIGSDGEPALEPILYEDFLPVSAAGILRSNLGDEAPVRAAVAPSQAAFEAALGQPVIDPFALYAAIEASSRTATSAAA